MKILALWMVGFVTVSGCRSTTDSGSASSNLESTRTELKLENIGVVYPAVDEFENPNPRPVFPAAFHVKSGYYGLDREYKINIAEPCKGQISINERTGEIGCNFGRGHFFVFARFQKVPVIEIEPGVQEPVETGRDRLQLITFEKDMAELKKEPTANTYTLTIIPPH